MKHRELGDGIQPIPANPMQLRQDTRPIPRRELDALEFPTSIGPNTQIELVGAVVAANYGRSGLEIVGDVVGIGDDERGRVQGDYGHIGYAENSLVSASPGVLDDQVAGQVLGLLHRSRSRGIGRGTRVVHGGRWSWAVRVVIRCVTAHGFDVRKVMEGVSTWHIVRSEKEPESHAGSSRWRRRRRSRGTVRPRLIRPQF